MNEDREREHIQDPITRIMKFCKIDRSGSVSIFYNNLSPRNKVLLVLCARYLANKLQIQLGKEPIVPDKISAKELADMLRVKSNVINARLKELKDDNEHTFLRELKDFKSECLNIEIRALQTMTSMTDIFYLRTYW